MSILDLLNQALSTELTASETAELRNILRRERGYAAQHDEEKPWESGITDVAPTTTRPPRNEVEALEDRVALLELTLKVVVDMLAAQRTLDASAFETRLRAIHHEVTERRRDEDESVDCVVCGKRVARKEAVRRATGILCASCHAGRRPSESPKMKEVVVPGATYRDAERKVLVEATEPCASCKTELTKAEAYRSSRGALCKVCFAELGDDT